MHIQFCGAAGEVTGSCHLLRTGAKNILVDCGMFQGGEFNEARNADAFPFNPKEIDALLVTHAHLDHVGRIAKLFREGFSGPVYMTKATIAMMELTLIDALHVMKYSHRKFQAPLFFDEKDIVDAVNASRGVDYGERVDLGGGVWAVWKDAGHIFGSAFIEVEADGKCIGFSGDIGNVDVPVLKDTEHLGAIDVLVCESTYGDRVHETKEQREKILLDLIREGAQKGGTIMVPAFSAERTQELLYVLDHLVEEDNTLPRLPIFLDSPLAINMTKVFGQYPEYYDVEASKQYMKGDNFLDFPGLTLTYDTIESKQINDVRPPKMIIAGSGMMNGGRIVHHARRYLSDPKSMLIIVGYQAHGTLGRRLYEGDEEVTIFGEKVPVRCSVKAIGAFSAHGDQKKLLDWIGSAEQKPSKIYYVHGEPHAATELAHRARDVFGIQGVVPEFGEKVEI